MAVILLNPFEVPAGKEQEAIEYWERGAEVLRKAPGYISTRLHRAISPDARSISADTSSCSMPC